MIPQDNRGVEGLAITPDGTKVYAMLQVRSGVLSALYLDTLELCGNQTSAANAVHGTGIEDGLIFIRGPV